MKILTKIAGVDNKLGRRSRTGSTVSMTIPDEFINDCSEYFLAVQKNQLDSSKIKKIELVLHYSDNEISSDDIENSIENMTTELDNAVDQSNNSQTKESLPANQSDLDIFNN